MSFSFYNSQNNFEYGGGSLRALFANPKNIYNPKFYRMLKDIVFFYKKFQKSNVSTELSIKDYLSTHSYSVEFINNHLLPLISSIWSTPYQNSLDQPLSSIITFFQNHQLFNFIQRPQWKTVSQGSSNYIKRLVAVSNFQIKMNATITSINREKTIQINTKDEKGLNFDFIIFACPPHQFLPLLDHLTDAERNILSTFQFQQNHIQLHQNTSWMPPHPTAWSSWNFHSNENQQCTLTYWMNLLQPLPTKDNFFVSLNQNQPNALYETYYDHPIFSLATKQAQQNIGKIQGGNNTYYVGSYLGYGFHEDGIQSALKVCEKMKVDLVNFKDADTSRVIWN
jgi:predicted NAD/FAD-binding protein